MYHAPYEFTILFTKLFSQLLGIIEGYSLWINSYTITTEYAWNVHISKYPFIFAFVLYSTSESSIETLVFKIYFFGIHFYFQLV